MVNTRKKIRKNYDEKRMHNTIYAREMQMNKERIRKRRQAKKRRERKKRKALETQRLLKDYINQKELEYCSSPEAKAEALNFIKITF